MPALKVLDLSGNRSLVELPSNIGNAKTLKYLNLSFTSLAKLPMGLGNLRNLSCLLLDYTTNLKWVPKEVISNLSLLQVYSKINGVREYFGSAKSLTYDEIAFLEVLECLNHINKIGITIFCAPSFVKVLQSYILRRCISKLTVMECSGLISLHFTEELSNLERFEIFRCSSLKEFKISGKCKLGNLSKVCIGVCPLLLSLNSLAYATNLESLTIFDCESLKEVLSEEMELRELKTISFTRLQSLKRICPSSRCFPSLLEIDVYKCPLLRQLPFDLESANFLQKIRGDTKWWDDLIWDDEAVKYACGLKFVCTPFELLHNLSPFPPRPPRPPVVATAALACVPPDRSAAHVIQQSSHLAAVFPPDFICDNDVDCRISDYTRRVHERRRSILLSYETESKALELENMDVIKVIGKGSGTIVQLVHHKPTGQFFALKIVEMDMEESVHRQIVNKLISTQSSPCPHVVVYYRSFYNNGAISIILEYMDGGSLADFLKKVKSIPEPYIAAICKQVLKGLIYLHHEAQVIHRDIKPSKLLINCRGDVKITDFVNSAEVMNSSGRANTFVGTYNYMSPERITGNSYGTEADIWSLGIVLLECATGKFPYPPPEEAEEWTNFFELMECIIEGPAPCAPSDQFSPEFCSFIYACLQKDPKERMSPQKLLEHPFMKVYGGAKVNLSSYFSNAGS